MAVRLPPQVALSPQMFVLLLLGLLSHNAQQVVALAAVAVSLDRL